MIEACLVSKRNFVLKEKERPRPEANQVTVDIAYCGICGSDIHAYHGTHPFMTYPIVLGHEFSGRISALGRQVKGLKEGQGVTVLPFISCKRCLNCRSGRSNVCKERKILGAQVPGAYTQSMVVDSDLIVPLPEALSLKSASLVEPIAVAVHAVKRARIRSGQKMLVVGCGPIGLFTAQVVRALGKPVELLVVDRNGFRVEIASKNDLKGIKASGTELEGILKAEFGENLHDTVFECSGSVEVLDGLLGIARSGSRIVLVSVLPSPQAMQNITSISEHELEIVGTSVYLKEDFVDAMRLLADGKIKTEGVITHSFRLEEVDDAFRLLSEPGHRAFKVVLKAGE